MAHSDIALVDPYSTTVTSRCRLQTVGSPGLAVVLMARAVGWSRQQGFQNWIHNGCRSSTVRSSTTVTSQKQHNTVSPELTQLPKISTVLTDGPGEFHVPRTYDMTYRQSCGMRCPQADRYNRRTTAPCVDTGALSTRKGQERLRHKVLTFLTNSHLPKRSLSKGAAAPKTSC